MNCSFTPSLLEEAYSDKPSGPHPGKRVLFDSHPPKGIHFHIDGAPSGTPFVGRSLTTTERMFFEMVCRHFDIDEKELP